MKDENKRITPKTGTRQMPRPKRALPTPGKRSNAEITRRNGGIRHQFINDIGGCSANYR